MVNLLAWNKNVPPYPHTLTHITHALHSQIHSTLSAPTISLSIFLTCSFLPLLLAFSLMPPPLDFQLPLPLLLLPLLLPCLSSAKETTNIGSWKFATGMILNKFSLI
jgi:hypothetical protein